tara:strand:- start:6623 stop:9595 length:2973 start_codon:yes stop_codon:yes gene_type:complete
MLINLSSENETDPAKFTNNFNEILEIKPNSYICLVKGSIIREKNQKQVSIPPDTDLFVRYTCYDVARLRLNPGGTANQVLSITAFVADINARFAQVGFAYTKAFRSEIREAVDGDLSMDLVFYHQALPAQVDFTLEAELYGNDNARITKYGEVFRNAQVATYPAGNGGPGVSTAALFSDATEWAIAPIWDTTYRTTNTNQTNGNSFCMLIDPHAVPNLSNNGYGPMQWFINQPNTNFAISAGRTTSNNAVPSQVLTGPIQGTQQGDNPNGKDYIAAINFEPNQANRGNFIAAAFDRDTQNFEVSGEVAYNPADYFEYYFRANTNLPIDFEHCFYSNLVHYRSNGLVFLYNGNLGTLAQRPGNANYFLTNSSVSQTIDDTTLNNMSYPYDNEHLKNLYYKQDRNNLGEWAGQFETDFRVTPTNFIAGNACLGVKGMNGFINNNFGANNYVANGAGWVYNQSLGRPATSQFTSAFANDGGIYNQYRFSTGVQGFNNRDGVQRANGSQIEIPSAYRINNNGGVVNNCPTMLCFSATFDLAAEAMVPANLDANIRTLCGNDTGRLFEIQLNQANTALPAGWDFRLTDSAGATYVNILVDGAGNRINFRSSTNAAGYTYNFIIRYFGPTTNSFSVIVEETLITGAGLTMATTQFQQQGPVMPLNANTHIADINAWGGRNPLTDNNAMTNYNDYSPLTYLCNFRIYQLSTRAGTDATVWDAQQAAMSAYFNQHPTYLNANDTFWSAGLPNDIANIDFYPNATNAFVLPTAAMGTAPNYNTTGISEPEANVNIIIEKIGAAGPIDANSPIINSLYIPANQIINETRRFTNLATADYAGSGEGLVSLTDAEALLDFVAPPPDANATIVQNPNFLNNTFENPTSTIETEIDEALVDPQAMNIEITNLTHTCLNGTNKSNDKTIYQLPMISETEEIGNNEIVEFTPPSKVWLSLNNPGPIYLNKMDVQISNTDGTKVDNTVIKQDTLVSIQIENDKNLLN